MRLFAIIENCFWEVIDRKLFWFCMAASVLLSLVFLLFGFEKKEEIDQKQKARETLRMVLEETTRPLKVSEISYPNQTTASVRLTSGGSKRFSIFFTHYFTPEQIEKHASFAGLHGVQIKGKPKLTVQLDQDESTVSIPKTVWNSYALESAPQNRFSGIQELDRPVPDEITSRFEEPIKQALSKEGGPEKLRVSIDLNVRFKNKVDLNNVPGIGQIDVLFGNYEIPIRRFSIHDFVLLNIERPLINYIVGWIGLIIAIVVTSSFVPDMLQDGQIDLVLSKSVPRWLVFLGRVLGASLFFGLIAAVFLILTSLFIYLRSGIFTGFLLFSFLPLMVTFFLVYIVSAFVGVLYENNILAMIAAFLAWFLMFVIEQAYSTVVTMTKISSDLSEDSTVYHVLEVANQMVPAPDKIQAIAWKGLVNTGALSEWTMNTHMQNEMKILENISIQNTVLTSIGFIVVMFGLSLVSFYNKEF